MRLTEAKKIIKCYCDHYEEWRCGRARIFIFGRSKDPRFDRKVEIYLDLQPYSVDIKKIASLLKLLDKLGTPINFHRLLRKKPSKK